MTAHAQDAGPPALITAAQVARLLQISMRTLWRMRSGGQLPAPVRVGSAVRWRIEEITKWIADGCPDRRGRENIRRRN
jgi:predicted DNA-binding transcriptional regulator AlpA